MPYQVVYNKPGRSEYDYSTAGNYLDKAEAEEAADKLKAEGYQNVAVIDTSAEKKMLENADSEEYWKQQTAKPTERKHWYFR